MNNRTLVKTIIFFLQKECSLFIKDSQVCAMFDVVIQQPTTRHLTVYMLISTHVV